MVNPRETQIKSTLICMMTWRAIFCSHHAGFRDFFRNRGRIFTFYASFEASFGAVRATLPTMGVALP